MAAGPTLAPPGNEIQRSHIRLSVVALKNGAVKDGKGRFHIIRTKNATVASVKAVTRVRLFKAVKAFRIVPEPSVDNHLLHRKAHPAHRLGKTLIYELVGMKLPALLRIAEKLTRNNELGAHHRALHLIRIAGGLAAPQSFIVPHPFRPGYFRFHLNGHGRAVIALQDRHVIAHRRILRQLVDDFHDEVIADLTTFQKVHERKRFFALYCLHRFFSFAF